MVKTEPPPDDDQVRKKKRRNLGQFPCSQCSKVFTRSDHLARHYLNHQPKEVYVCEKLIKNHNGEQRVCGKTFVRKDLKERHLKRHKLLDGDEAYDDESESPVKEEEEKLGRGQSPLRHVQSNQQPVNVDHGPGVPHQGMLHNGIPPNQQNLQSQPNPGNLPNAHFQGPTPPSFQNSNHQNIGPVQGQVQQNLQGVAMAPNMHPQMSHHIPQQPLPPQHNIQQGVVAQAPMGGFPGHGAPQGVVDGMVDPRGPVSPEFRMNPNVPQSSTDILSWLFTDQDPAFSKDMMVNAPEYVPMEMPRQMSPKQPEVEVAPIYYNVPEAMINMNLQDLNFFSNNDNPLDEVFLRPPEGQIDQSAPKGWNISSTNSSTPNTTETLTPRSLSDHSPESLSVESIESRVAQLASNNVAKNRHFFVDATLMERLASCLPGVTIDSFNKILRPSSSDPLPQDRLSFYLYGYWEIFHPRFSILHKPSFDTKTAEPLLLLAMIIVGCSYCSTTESYSSRLKHCPEYKLAMLIVAPLRFTLFQHEEFRSPVRVWILQTLNLLEWVEKNCLQRSMHERAHIHHGTTVQLLRRSPFLGGNPTVTNKELTSASENTSAGEEDVEDLDEVARSDQALFNKWVESESMKRVTFMTFYLDVIDYIKFRHNPQIPFYQLQLLNLPCEEEALWASYEINGSFKKTIKRQKKIQKSGARSLKNQNNIKPGMNFMSALKRVMKHTKASSKVSLFTKHVLFGGIVSIMHSMQQTELQNSFSQIMASERQVKNRNQKWKEIITSVFDDFDHEIYGPSSGFSKDGFFNINRWQCTFPMYHLAQIIGMSDINHYDIAIFGGSPANMSVDATSKDLSIVQKKLNSMWMRSLPAMMKNVGDLINYKCVIHCYWLLWGMMLTPLNKDGQPAQPLSYDWRVDHDVHDSLYAASIATLVLWCYCFSVYGAESTKFAEFGESLSLKDTRSYEKIAEYAAEEGYSYLYRVRQEFTDKIKAQGLGPESLLHSTRPMEEVSPSKIVNRYSEILPTISNKQNISGLCFLVGTKLLRSQWSVLRENAKLIINCGLRSAGKKEVCCSDLFVDDFVD
ncbi:uncharacterized protein CXQ87_005277 [Candidozyma duobushaemuli]|nr:uncharacterized protein CXQ87_005277 [[Candida] duobushaemulonis]PVH14998.1 hypothetical protein CXQ87_005277 [[Candida] duobushaemulonis]